MPRRNLNAGQPRPTPSDGPGSLIARLRAELGPRRPARHEHNPTARNQTATTQEEQ